MKITLLNGNGLKLTTVYFLRHAINISVEVINKTEPVVI